MEEANVWKLFVPYSFIELIDVKYLSFTFIIKYSNCLIQDGRPKNVKCKFLSSFCEKSLEIQEGFQVKLKLNLSEMSITGDTQMHCSKEFFDISSTGFPPMETVSVKIRSLQIPHRQQQWFSFRDFLSAPRTNETFVDIIRTSESHLKTLMASHIDARDVGAIVSMTTSARLRPSYTCFIEDGDATDCLLMSIFDIRHLIENVNF